MFLNVSPELIRKFIRRLGVRLHSHWFPVPTGESRRILHTHDCVQKPPGGDYWKNEWLDVMWRVKQKWKTLLSFDTTFTIGEREHVNLLQTKVHPQLYICNTIHLTMNHLTSTMPLERSNCAICGFHGVDVRINCGCLIHAVRQNSACTVFRTVETMGNGFRTSPPVEKYGVLSLS